MADELTVVAMGSIAEIAMGQSPPGKTYNEIGDGLPFYQGVRDFGVRYPKRRVYCTSPTRFAEPGDILFSVRAPIGRVNLATEKCAIGRGLAAIRSKDPLDQTYLEVVLRARSDEWHTLESQGSVFGNARKSDLMELPITWPNPEVRRAIAHILGTLDDKVELNQRTNETLDTLARAIFQSWFVDFNPVRAKAEDLSTGLPREMEELFPNGFRESKLGEIPEGWEVRCFSDLAYINPPRELKKGTEALYVEMKLLPERGNQIVGDPILREYTSGSRFRNGDTLLARITPCLENGKTALVDFLPDSSTGWGSTEFIVLGPKVAGSYFIYCAARWNHLRDYAIREMTGSSGRQRVPHDAFDNLWLAVPDAGLLNSFEDLLKVLFSATKSSTRQSRNLTVLCDILLPKLLSGKIQIEDPGKFLGEVGP